MLTLERTERSRKSKTEEAIKAVSHDLKAFQHHQFNKHTSGFQCDSYVEKHWGSLFWNWVTLHITCTLLPGFYHHVDFFKRDLLQVRCIGLH